MKKDVKDRKLFWRIATITIGAILLASIGIVWIGGAIEGASPVSTYVGSPGPDIPHLLNYQGVLTDSAGNPVPDGNYQMTFGIYDNETDGNLLWSETQTVQVSEGLFNVLLGSVNPIPADVFCGGADRWIGMKVGDDPEMTPRQRIVSVAYAYAAECAQGIAAGHGLEIKDANGNVTHRLNSNGTSWHAGMETFDGGIKITGPHESPSWRTVITANGGSKMYDESGTLRYEEFPDGSTKIYREDGTLKYEEGEEGADGSWKSYREDGTLKCEEGADGSQKSYYEDGTLRYEKSADGSTKTYREDGTLRYEKSADGSTKTYYEDGTLKCEKGADGSSKCYDSDGNLERVEKSNGDSSQTGEHRCGETGSSSRYTYMKPGGMGVIGPDGTAAATIYPCGSTWFRGDGTYGSNLGVRGDFNCFGTKNAVVETANYGNRTTYCEEAAEVYFFDRGEAQLENGEVTVELDPIFLETVTLNATNPMLVQLTLTGDCNGVYVAQRTASNFTVRELSGGNTNAGFMWEAAAKRKGYEDTRLEEVI